MKKIKFIIYLTLLFCVFSVKTQAEEIEENANSAQEVELPNGYFDSSSDTYQEESTTEGPDGPPAPINDWVPLFFILGIAIVGKHYLHTKKRV